MAGQHPQEPSWGTYLLHLPCVRSAIPQRAPRRHPDHQSGGLEAGWPRPGLPRWGRCLARCRKKKTAWAPTSPGLSPWPGRGQDPSQPVHTQHRQPPAWPTPSTCLSFQFPPGFPLLQQAEWPAVVRPGSAARCGLGENPSAATYLAPECFSFLLFKVGIVMCPARRLAVWMGHPGKARRRSWHSENAHWMCVLQLCSGTPLRT